MAKEVPEENVWADCTIDQFFSMMSGWVVQPKYCIQQSDQGSVFYRELGSTTVRVVLGPERLELVVRAHGSSEAEIAVVKLLDSGKFLVNLPQNQKAFNRAFFDGLRA